MGDLHELCVGVCEHVRRVLCGLRVFGNNLYAIRITASVDLLF